MTLKPPASTPQASIDDASLGGNMVNIESIRLKLIQGKAQSDQWDVTFKKEGLRYLIKALAYADASFSSEIEEVLLKAGTVAVPMLIKGLYSKFANVRSVCAMVLIRIGDDAKQPLHEAYNQRLNDNVSWAFEFILEELGVTLPSVKAVSKTRSTVTKLKA